MTVPPPRGLPPRVYLPIVALVAVVLIGTMAYLLRIGFGVTGSAFGIEAAASPGARASAAAPPVANATDDPRVVTIPQTGTGPVGGQGGPPVPVRQALDDAKARLAKNPSDLAALVLLAHLYRDAGKFDRSASYYRRALALDSQNPDTGIELADVLHSGGRDLDAMREVERVLARKPRYADALFEQGRIAEAIGRRGEAVSALRGFLAAAPSDSRAQEARDALTRLGAQ